MKKLIFIILSLVSSLWSGDGFCPSEYYHSGSGKTWYLSGFFRSTYASTSYGEHYLVWENSRKRWECTHILNMSNGQANQYYYSLSSPCPSGENYDVTTGQCLSPAPTCTETEDEIDGQCFPKCPDNSFRLENNMCSCNTGYIFNLNGSTCYKMIEEPISDNICPTGYVYSKGGCYKDGDTYCNSPYIPYPSSSIIDGSSNFDCISLSATPNLINPSPNDAPTDYCYLAYESKSIDAVNACRSCVSSCGSVSNTVFSSYGSLVQSSSCSCIDGRDGVTSSDLNRTVFDEQVTDSDNNGVIDNYEVVEAINETQNETLQPLLETGKLLAVQSENVNIKLGSLLENSTKFLVIEEEINGKLQTTITLDTERNQKLELIRQALSNDDVDTGLGGKIDKTNSILERIEQAIKDLNTTVKSTVPDTNVTATDSNSTASYPKPTDKDGNPITIKDCNTCPRGFKNINGVCFLNGGSPADWMACPSDTDPDIIDPSEGDSNITTPDSNTTEGDCGMFSPLVPESLEGIVCGGEEADEAFFTSKFKDDGWISSNTINVTFTGSNESGCYFEEIRLPLLNKTIGEDQLNYIPLDLLADLFLALVILQGVREFLRVD